MGRLESKKGHFEADTHKSQGTNSCDGEGEFGEVRGRLLSAQAATCVMSYSSHFQIIIVFINFLNR